MDIFIRKRKGINNPWFNPSNIFQMICKILLKIPNHVHMPIGYAMQREIFFKGHLLESLWSKALFTTLI